MKVLVVGAAGYIGNTIANSLRTHGHRVTGIVRREEQKASLERAEIPALVCDALDERAPVPWAQFEVVIMAITSTEWDKQKRIVSDAHAAGAHIVYISGCLVYGDHPNQVIDETASCPPSGRLEMDTLVLGHGGVVVRPGFIYGRSFGHYASAWFRVDKDVTIEGNRHRTYPYVHIDDVGHALVALLGSPWNAISGHIYDLADSTRMTYEEVRILFAKAAGYTGAYNYTDTPSWGNVSCLSSGKKIVRSTAFQYRHGPLQDEIEIGWMAFKHV